MAWPKVPIGFPVDFAVLWRCAVVALLPVGFWACDLALYDYVPDRAAGVAYEVRVNRLTGATCLRFQQKPPPGLDELRC